jgi:putative acetyltransferase
MEADVPDLARIAVASYRATFLSIMGEEGLAVRSQSYFLQRFTGQWPSIRLAEDASGRITGFCQVREGKLDMLFLYPEETGRGLGTLLLNHAERAGALYLECFRDNHGARRFYERHGWRLDREFRQKFAGAERDIVAYRKG